jgi:hypothetical protein
MSLEISMNTNPTETLLLSFIAAIGLVLSQNSSAQDAKPANPEATAKQAEAAKKPNDTPKQANDFQKATPVDPETRFKALLTKAFLAGRWAPLKDGELGEERTGDKYNIVSVTKGSGENWTVNAKMKYREQEVVLPIPVQVKFAGDTAILIVDKLSIPGGGTYSARLLFYERTYSGTWSGGRGGGMLYGTITNEKE